MTQRGFALAFPLSLISLDCQLVLYQTQLSHQTFAFSSLLPGYTALCSSISMGECVIEKPKSITAIVFMCLT